MNKKLSLLIAALMVFVGAALVSCSGSDADAKVNTFVDQLNSDTFKDSVVVLTFKTIPGLSFKNATKELMAAQKSAMLEQFKTAIPADKVFREGFEGMKEKEMVFRMVFLDTNGDTAGIDIAPSEVL